MCRVAGMSAKLTRTLCVLVFYKIVSLGGAACCFINSATLVCMFSLPKFLFSSPNLIKGNHP